MKDLNEIPKAKKIYATLALRKDFTEKLFEKEMSN